MPYLLLLFVGCDGSDSGMTKAGNSATPATARPVPPTATAIPSPTPTATPTATPVPTPTLPQRIIIPDVNVDAEMVPVGLDKDGGMAAPEGPDVVGWYSRGPRPGARGNVLASGHRDWTDPRTGRPRTAVFWRLGELVPGNIVLVNDATRQYTYVVRETIRYIWDDPEALKHLNPSEEPILTLITCEGVYYPATRNYTHRRIVVAELQSSAPLNKAQGNSNGR